MPAWKPDCNQLLHLSAYFNFPMPHGVFDPVRKCVSECPLEGFDEDEKKSEKC